MKIQLKVTAMLIIQKRRDSFGKPWWCCFPFMDFSCLKLWCICVWRAKLEIIVAIATLMLRSVIIQYLLYCFRPENSKSKMGYSRKNPHPHDRRQGFLTPPPTWISKTVWAPLPLGFPSSKTLPPIWISIKLLDTVILIYPQCRRILLST